VRLRVEALRALRLNYTRRGVWIWLKGRKRSGRRGWQRLWQDAQWVRDEQRAIAEGVLS
jgi:hypothetical protein